MYGITTKMAVLSISQNSSVDNTDDDLLSIEKDNFANFDICDNKIVRSIVLESWKRSKKSGVDSANVKSKVLSKKDIDARLKENNKLLMIAFPHIENIYSFVKGSGFAVSFCDKDGYILKIIGDKEVIQAFEEYSNLCVGVDRSESSWGTNAIGTSIFLDQPLQIRGSEHYKKMLNVYTCSACPIHDEFNNVIGCINLTGRKENVQNHTLGMVIAAVDGIEKEFKINNAYDKIYIINNQLSTILNSMDTAIIVISESGNILNINNVALNTFKLDYNSCISNKINKILCYNIKIINLEEHNKNYDNIELEIQNKRYNVTKYNYNNKFAQSAGSIITFKEMKSVHKMVSKYSGFTASYTIDNIIGQSPKMLYAKNLCLKLAKSSSTVLILGESGTGKELIAQSIHNASDRKNEPFIAINCGALPKGLIESELFGYEGGSFTGANKEGKPGKFELADGGTIFLDEIGDMPLDTQVSILRVLQNKEITRIGSTKAKKVDIRVIAATNKNLLDGIKNNSFREDLYYRLNVLTITIPPLRERIDDLYLLINYFINHYNDTLNKNISKVDDAANVALSSYLWPGNVRELENVIERAINIVDSDIITINDLPNTIQNSPNNSNSNNITEIKQNTKGNNVTTFENKKIDFIKEEVVQALTKYDGDTEKTAEFLGISRRTLYRKIDKLDINLKKFRNKKL